MSGLLKHKGTPVAFAIGTLMVPPLSLASVESLKGAITGFTGSLDDCSTVIDCLHQALVRNYPDATREQVAVLVDLGNMNEVMQAIMQVSGLVSVDEAAASGKLVATTL